MERQGSSQHSGKQIRRNVSAGNSGEDQGLDSSSGEEKSVSAGIAESLAKEGQESIDRAMTKISDWFEEGNKYVSQKPWEAALMVASFSLTAWVLLTTKPGRKIFNAGAATFVPKISKWISTTFAQPSSQATH